MTDAQTVALVNHCRIAEECALPKFGSVVAPGVSLVLTVNSGYE